MIRLLKFNVLNKRHFCINETTKNYFHNKNYDDDMRNPVEIKFTTKQKYHINCMIEEYKNINDRVIAAEKQCFYIKIGFVATFIGLVIIIIKDDCLINRHMERIHDLESRQYETKNQLDDFKNFLDETERWENKIDKKLNELDPNSYEYKNKTQYYNFMNVMKKDNSIENLNAIKDIREELKNNKECKCECKDKIKYDNNIINNKGHTTENLNDLKDIKEDLKKHGDAINYLHDNTAKISQDMKKLSHFVPFVLHIIIFDFI